MSASRMFPVTDFFEIKKGKRLTKANMVPGDIPFVGSSATNNGITAYIGNDTHLHEPGTITVSYNGSVGEVFLQDERFWASDDVNVWYPKQKMAIEVKLYFMAAIKKLSAKYSYTNKWTIDKMRSELVELPVDSDGKPNFNCMQERIAELEQERIAELDVYLAASGLDDYELTDEDKEILSLSPESASDEANASEADFGNGQVVFKAFKVGELFDIHPTSAYKMKNDELFASDGTTPVLSNSSVNNGIGGYCGLTPIEQGGMITFSDTTTGADTMFYQSSPFIGYPHVQGMYPYQPDKWNEKCCLYVISRIRKSAGNGWSYAVKFNRVLVKELSIELPIIASPGLDHECKVDDINFDYMERYIRAIEKLAIADVAKYKDKLIAATKQVVGM